MQIVYSAVQQDVIDAVVARYKLQATQSAVMRYVHLPGRCNAR